MTSFKTFCENAEISYNLSVKANGEVVYETYYLSDTTMQEELYKVDKVIADKLKEQYEALPESGL